MRTHLKRGIYAACDTYCILSEMLSEDLNAVTCPRCLELADAEAHIHERRRRLFEELEGKWRDIVNSERGYDDPEAERLADQMDDLWLTMTAEERFELNNRE